MKDSLNSMHIVVYGPEGSGKGTQAKILGEFLKLPVYTTGDLVREAAQNDLGEIGKGARNALSSGCYLSDEEVFILLQQRLSTTSAKCGFILDGFPRTLAQAKLLLQAVKKYGYRIDKLIYINISDEVATTRLLKRKRPIFPGSLILHDTPERINQRLKIYRRLEKDVLRFFREKNILIEIDGNNTPEKVFKDILQRLNLP